MEKKIYKPRNVKAVGELEPNDELEKDQLPGIMFDLDDIVEEYPFV
jgi:predicted HAD superfamily phosphohydrolase YqeG